MKETYQVRRARLCMTNDQIAEAISTPIRQVSGKRVCEAMNRFQRGEYLRPQQQWIVNRVELFLSKREKERGIS